MNRFSLIWWAQIRRRSGARDFRIPKSDRPSLGRDTPMSPAAWRGCVSPCPGPESSADTVYTGMPERRSALPAPIIVSDHALISRLLILSVRPVTSDARTYARMGSDRASRIMSHVSCTFVLRGSLSSLGALSMCAGQRRRQPTGLRPLTTTSRGHRRIASTRFARQSQDLTPVGHEKIKVRWVQNSANVNQTSTDRCAPQ